MNITAIDTSHTSSLVVYLENTLSTSNHIGTFDYTALADNSSHNLISAPLTATFLALQYTLNSVSVLLVYKTNVSSPIEIVHSNIDGVKISNPLNFGNNELFDDLVAFPHSKYFIYSSHGATTLEGYLRFIHYYN